MFEIKTKYKFVIDGNEYKYAYGTTDLEGNQFAIFEKRKLGFCIGRVKFAKEDLEIDNETGMCSLKVVK